MCLDASLLFLGAVLRPFLVLLILLSSLHPHPLARHWCDTLRMRVGVRIYEYPCCTTVSFSPAKKNPTRKKERCNTTVSGESLSVAVFILLLCASSASVSFFCFGCPPTSYCATVYFLVTGLTTAWRTIDSPSPLPAPSLLAIWLLSHFSSLLSSPTCPFCCLWEAFDLYLFYPSSPCRVAIRAVCPVTPINSASPSERVEPSGRTLTAQHRRREVASGGGRELRCSHLPTSSTGTSYCPL